MHVHNVLHLYFALLTLSGNYRVTAKFVFSAFVIVLKAFSAFCVQSGLGIRFKNYV